MDEQRYFNRGLGLKKTVSGLVVADYHGSLVARMKAEDRRLTAGDLTFLLPRELGFCYGVDRAIEYAYEARERFPGKRICITGEIIHNPGVNHRLVDMGVVFLSERDGDPSYDSVTPDDVVILPAFGVPVDDMNVLRQIGCIVVDTTCGSVLNVWKNVERYARDGYTALIHGKYAHEETRATASRALEHDGGHYIVVLDMAEADLVCEMIEGRAGREAFLERFAPAVSPGFDPERHLGRLGCANQTTMLSTESLAIAEKVRQALLRRHGEDEIGERFRAFDTICTATQDRQDALRALLEEDSPDLMLVIGGYNSSNTGHLLEIAGESVPSFHVLDASCIEDAGTIRHQPVGAKAETRTRGWLPEGVVRIGVTSGASTPDSEVDAVMLRILELREGSPPDASGQHRDQGAVP
jgi:4-hydroxy-3-methylbut-2-enyl diphosphate reductase